jgi:hypothetical protein
VKKVSIISFVALLVLFAGVHVLAFDTKLLVKGTVYWDQNRDGKYDRNEPGIANVCVFNGREALSLATKSFNEWSDQLQAWLAQDVFARTAASPVNINDLPDQGSISANELCATTLVTNVWNGRSDHTVCCQFDRGQSVKAVRSQTVCDPFALRQQLYVLRYAIGFNIWNNEVKPAAPQPWSGLLGTSSTHIRTYPLPEKLPTGIHCVKVKVYDRHYQLLYSDLLNFEVTGGPK